MKPLPDYAWASTSAQDAGVPAGDWSVHLPAVSLTDVAAALPDSPFGAGAPLVRVTHPHIRTMSAYWHEGWPHAVAGTWLRPEAAEKLAAAVERLPDGFGLAVWDAWRDPRLQAVLHDTAYADGTLAPGFVAFPDPDPRRCPPHASGGTVDLTLTWRHVPLSLGTRFDAFVPQAAADALEPDGPRMERDLRRLLGNAMTGAGFVGHPQEWWHWEYGTRVWGALTGRRPLFGRAAAPDDPSGADADRRRVP